MSDKHNQLDGQDSTPDKELNLSESSSEGIAKDQSEIDPKLEGDGKDSAESMLPWYILSAKTGSEGRAVEELKELILNADLGERFGQILAPTEEVIEVRGGQKRTVNKRMFPGYLFLQVDMDLEFSHFIVGEVSRVTGFLGVKKEGGGPKPLRKDEVETMLARVNPEEGKKPVSSVIFAVGEVVSIIDGPFADFEGTVEKVAQDKLRLIVSVSIFGRNTPVELDFSQVNKL